MLVASPRSSMNRVTGFLKQRHPSRTADGVALDTGIPANTVSKWLRAESSPNATHLSRLAGAYGPEVYAAFFDRAPVWLVKSVETFNSRGA